MISERSLYEIEVAIAKSFEYDFTKNLVVFNVFGVSSVLELDHECDVLICSKSGYLTEIEIKRSYEDFLADFKKKFYHNHCGIIKHFYYCISELFADKAIHYLKDNKIECEGVYVYNENGTFRFSLYYLNQSSPERWNAKKLFLEQQLYLARLGTMRGTTLREKQIEDKSIFKNWFRRISCNYYKLKDEKKED